MIPHHHIHHGSIDSLLFLKPVLIILSVLMFHTYVCISQENNREGYEKCKDNFVCGNLVDVGYPFWGEHHNTDDGKDRPEYCGLPEYKLDCYGGDIAEIKISQESYHVFHINPEGQVMNITSKDFMDDDDACPAKYPTVNFDSDAVFNRAPDVDLLILHFGCSGINNLDQHKFNCQINNNTGASSRRSIDSYWYIDIPTQFFLSCTSGVSVPVMSAALRDLTTERVPAVIKQGFSASYRSSMYVNSIDVCENCKRSGGSCGYNTARGIPTCYSAPKSKRKKIAIGVGCAAAASLLTALLFFLIRRQRRKNNLHKNSTLISRSISPDLSMQPDPEKGSSYFNTPIFSYKELEEATNNFDSSKELGDGGFGTVYYGKLKDGRAVAVKRLYENNCKRVEQFMNEVNILSLLRHQNLVSLYGCTSRHSRELLLVYEYVANGTVADHLHGEHSSAGMVIWPIRLSIAIESADALVYLHASDIIHRDVKTNNILLDKNFHVKVADFGLSRLFPNDVTHVSTAPQGTPGYVDPDYYQCYQLTDKSDVYSFGVVLCELISSKPAVDINRHRHEINLSTMALNKIHGDALHELVDMSLGFDTNASVRKTMTLVAELAYRCLQQDTDARPSMAEVLEVLKEIEVEGSKVVKPGEWTDDAKLLKNYPPVSPNSVTDKWASITSTPNTSS